MEKAEKKTLQEHDNNPFIADLLALENIYPRKISLKKDRQMWDEDTGESYPIKVNTGDFDYDWKDDRTYKKVFSDYTKTVSKLSSAAGKMFFFVLEKLPVNRDTVIIKPKEFLDYSGFNARAQYYTAVRELVVARIIAKSKAQGMFYINPCVFFNGTVSKLLPDARLEFMKLASEENTRKKNRTTRVEEPGTLQKLK